MFSQASTREQSKKRSETRLCEARALRARKTLTPGFTDFFTDFERKNRLFCGLHFQELLVMPMPASLVNRTPRSTRRLTTIT